MVALWPYITKCYLKQETGYREYVVYDAFSYIYFGYQKYGLLTKESLPAYLRAVNRIEEVEGEVPVETAFFSNKVKREMGSK